MFHVEKYIFIICPGKYQYRGVELLVLDITESIRKVSIFWMSGIFT